MKYIIFFISLLALSFLLVQCKTTQVETESKLSIVIKSSESGPGMTVSFSNGLGYNRPTYALWVEDMEGNYKETIFITKSYASGVFGHEMQGDSVWKNTSGPSYQPAALPYWTHKKGLIDEKSLIPTPEHPFVDAYTGATPEQSFEIKTKESSQAEKYRILLEVNQSWDWNSYWTNNKYPENTAYKHSAQPSIIYAVEINKEGKDFFMNPIGHGDPKGESGNLFTDLSTLSTAKEIFQSIEIQVNY